MIELQERRETARGCGLRKKGGLYLVADGSQLELCGRLPVALDVCPCCGAGFKWARGWTWCDADRLLEEARSQACPTCQEGEMALGSLCPFRESNAFGRSGLVWAGAKFYPTPDDFIGEAMDRGFSRRINTVPKGFEVGRTRVLVAHIHAGGPNKPGIITAFRPEAIEVVCDGSESQEELEAYARRGLTPVKVVPLDDGGNELPLESAHPGADD